MTFQPGNRVRIVRATGAKNPESWEGLLCRVSHSYHAEGASLFAEDGTEICVLIPLTPRPDNGRMGESAWFAWRTNLLQHA
jgi:hypothetical protein